ncbi:hypothetical protein [Streptomyces sp. Y7]|uniref:hypothetical protein n=1 Tax=Streptomyces sp. Y7 TaxID=3342392 RepID=UPI0037225779
MTRRATPPQTISTRAGTRQATWPSVTDRTSAWAGRRPAPNSAWAWPPLFRRLPMLHPTAPPASLALSTSTVHGVRSLPVARR